MNFKDVFSESNKEMISSTMEREDILWRMFKAAFPGAEKEFKPGPEIGGTLEKPIILKMK